MSTRLSRPNTPSSKPVDTQFCTSGGTPSLCDVLCGQAPPPWNHAAFKKFLARNYCTEVLSFTAAVVTYRNTYATLQRSPPDSTQREILVQATSELWNDLLETYIASNAVSEINIPGGTRNALLSYTDANNPPSPDVLQTAYNLMYDLMGGVFVQFIESIDARDREISCS